MSESMRALTGGSLTYLCITTTNTQVALDLWHPPGIFRACGGGRSRGDGAGTAYSSSASD